MLFNTLQFAIFFPAVVLLYYNIPHKFRWIQLLIASYIFYMCWNPAFSLLLIVSTLITYTSALMMQKSELGKIRISKKAVLVISLILNLGILFVFKYLGLFTQGVYSLLDLTGISYTKTAFSIALPVGISFYIFKSTGYIIDVYRNKIPAEKHLGKFAVFVSFFPELLAGPIDRADKFLPQLEIEHKFNYPDVTNGIKLMALGYFKKCVVADTICVYVNSVYDNIAIFDGFGYLFATFLFAIQIYCDFSGYSDIARGAGQILGFSIPKNFDHPYFSTSIKDFWRRWHISLSTWFRDYLYFPLGGSRCSKFRTYCNLMIVFLVSGLWHGASITYIVWGGLHGIYQVIGGLTRNIRNRLSSVIRLDKTKHLKNAISIVITFALVCIAWIFFRANTVSDAWHILTHLFDFGEFSKSYVFDQLKSMFSIRAEFYRTFCILPIFFLYGFIDYFKPVNTIISKQKMPVRYIIYILIMLYIILFTRSGMQDFIYQQF